MKLTHIHRLTALGLAVGMTTALAACGNTAETAESTAETAESTDGKIPGMDPNSQYWDETA